MKRVRLKSNRGCIRCKERHKKCNEVRPTCSFCRHWRLVCVWSKGENPLRAKRFVDWNASPSSRMTQAVSRNGSNTLYRAPCATAPSLDPFCAPVLSGNDQGEMVSSLQQFFILVARQNLPFEDVGARNEVAQGWFESALLEKVACYSLLSYWAKSQSRMTGHTGLRMLSVRLEIRTLSFLRHLIESGCGITEEVLLAAAVHFASTAIDTRDGSYLRRMLRGIKALVDSSGGIDYVVAEMRPSTIFCVQYTDILSLLVNADEPLFTRLEKPHRPPSFLSVHNPRQLHSLANISTWLDSEVFDAAELLEFLLCFRNPSRQTRSLLPQEYEYLRSLEYWLNYQLGLLQHKYAGTGLMDEIMVTAMLVAKLEVFAEGSQHSCLILAVLKRLRTAISSSESIYMTDCQAPEIYKSLTTWACFVALVGQSLSALRAWFFGYVQMVLMRRYGEPCADWPDGIENEVLEELQQFPWHSRIDVCFISVCVELRYQLQERYSHGLPGTGRIIEHLHLDDDG